MALFCVAGMKTSYKVNQTIVSLFNLRTFLCFHAAISKTISSLKDFLSRAIYLHPNGDRFVISETRGNKNLWEDSEFGWQQKIDYINADGSAIVTLGTFGGHPFLNTPNFG